MHTAPTLGVLGTQVPEDLDIGRGVLESNAGRRGTVLMSNAQADGDCYRKRSSHAFPSLPVTNTWGLATKSTLAKSSAVTDPTSPLMFAVCDMPTLVQLQVETPSEERHQTQPSLPATNRCGLWGDVGVSITLTTPTELVMFTFWGLLISSSSRPTRHTIDTKGCSHRLRQKHGDDAERLDCPLPPTRPAAL